MTTSVESEVAQHVVGVRGLSSRRVRVVGKKMRVVPCARVGGCGSQLLVSGAVAVNGPKQQWLGAALLKARQPRRRRMRLATVTLAMGFVVFFVP